MAPPRTISLAYSMADQNFSATKSLGIFNLSTQLAGRLGMHPAISPLRIFSNRTLPRLPGPLAPAAIKHYDLAIRGRLGRLWWDQWRVYRAAQAAAVDWLFLPKGFASFIARPPVALACYVHDTVHQYYADRRLKVFSGPERWLFQACLRATLKYASIVFTNSAFTRAEVNRFAARQGLTPGPVEVAGIGFDPRPERSWPKTESVLAWVSPWPHKRTDLLLEYLRRWRRSAGRGQTVHLVGRLPSGIAPPSDTGWVRHDRPAEPAYQELLTQARATVYLSEYEGFGMPPVEALLAGACPVYSDIPAARETMGGVGFAFSNESYEAFANAMNHAIRTTPDTIAAWSELICRRHNWSRVVDRIIAGLLACRSGERRSSG